MVERVLRFSDFLHGKQWCRTQSLLCSGLFHILPQNYTKGREAERFSPSTPRAALALSRDLRQFPASLPPWVLRVNRRASPFAIYFATLTLAHLLQLDQSTYPLRSISGLPSEAEIVSQDGVAPELHRTRKNIYHVLDEYEPFFLLMTRFGTLLSGSIRLTPTRAVLGY
jgi:hypothetical protein